MRKLTLTLCLSLWIISAFGQYKKPYRITYDSSDKAYFITNRGEGSVLKLDSNYKVTKIITGLKDPRDLMIGSLAGNKGLMVIDSNQIVVYNYANFVKMTAFNVTNAVEIDDIEASPTNAGEFYLTDVGADKIIHGKIGSAPFFTPTYSTLISSGINRPKGLMFNSSGELLVVSDEDSAKVYKVDLSNGKLTPLLSSGLDSLNSITQDGEGNYFLTNWGNSFLYRCDKNFNNLTKLTAYNKPAGMIVNRHDDLLIVLCHLCNKLEFHKLHYFEPVGQTGACVGDSFDIPLSIAAEGVGSYNTGNRFEIELTDSNRDYAKVVVIGSVSSTTTPKSIRCVLPPGDYGQYHSYRIKSTNPEFYSSKTVFTPYPTPDLDDIVSNWTLCKGSLVNIGVNSDTGTTYVWNDARHLDDSTTANPLFQSSDSGNYTYQLVATNNTYGCIDSAEVSVTVYPDIQLPTLKYDVEFCQGESDSIGVRNSPYTFSWQPKIGLLRTDVPNPLFLGVSSQKYYVHVEDKTTGCEGNDSVDVVVHDNPTLIMDATYYKVCSGDSLFLNSTTDTSNSILWNPTTNLSDSTVVNPIFTSSDSIGVFDYKVTVRNNFGCTLEEGLVISNNSTPMGAQLNQVIKCPKCPVAYIEGVLPINTVGELYVMKHVNDSAWLGGSFDTLNFEMRLDDIFANGEFLYGFMKVISDSGCVWFSDTIRFVFLSINEVTTNPLQIYPNPAQDQVTIFSSNSTLESVELYSLSGKKLPTPSVKASINSLSVDTQSVPNGMYVMVIKDSKGSFIKSKLVILK